MTILEEFREEFDKQKAGQKIPGDTCPLIDKLIHCISESRRAINGYPRRYGQIVMDEVTDLADARERLQSADRCLEDLDSLLEMIRQDNEKLRNLGKDWYEINKGALEALELEDAWKEVSSGL